jgi:hypothetical protein
MFAMLPLPGQGLSSCLQLNNPIISRGQIQARVSHTCIQQRRPATSCQSRQALHVQSVLELPIHPFSIWTLQTRHVLSMLQPSRCVLSGRRPPSLPASPGLSSRVKLLFSILVLLSILGTGSGYNLGWHKYNTGSNQNFDNVSIEWDAPIPQWIQVQKLFCMMCFSHSQRLNVRLLCTHDLMIRTL